MLSSLFIFVILPINGGIDYTSFKTQWPKEKGQQKDKQ
jgi:hypothetical protein